MDFNNKVQATLFRTMGGMLSPAGPRAKLIILTYHRVLPAPDSLMPGEVDAKGFDRQVELLQSQFNILPLSEAAERLTKNTLPTRPLCITFDDGYANNHDIALPVLKKWGVQATFFIAVDFLEGGRMWNDTVIEVVRASKGEVLDLKSIGLDEYPVSDIASRKRAIKEILLALKYLKDAERQIKVRQLEDIFGETLPTGLMMSHQQLRNLRDSEMEIGGHTLSHPILTSLSEDNAVNEIVRSRQLLQEITDTQIATFAYPNGRPGKDYNKFHVEAVRQAGYQAAVSTAPGCSRGGDDLYQLPRQDYWDNTALHFSGRMLRTYINGRAQVI